MGASLPASQLLPFGAAGTWSGCLRDPCSSVDGAIASEVAEMRVGISCRPERAGTFTRDWLAGQRGRTLCGALEPRGRVARFPLDGGGQPLRRASALAGAGWISALRIAGKKSVPHLLEESLRDRIRAQGSLRVI